MAISKYQTRHARFSGYGADLGSEMNLDAHSFDKRFEDRAGRLVDLLIHQMQGVMH
jgi:hypothetical protein